MYHNVTMNASAKKILVNGLSVLLAGLTLFFLGKSVVHHWEKIQNYTFHFSLPLLFAASAAYAVTFFVFSLGWFTILKHLHHPIPLLESFLYFCITQPAKYIPGKVWIAVTRMRFCKPKNIPNSVTVLSTGIEGVMEIIAGTYVSMMALLNMPIFGKFAFWGPVIITTLGVILLIPDVFYFGINLYLKIVKGTLIHAEKRASFLQLLLLQIIYLIGMVGIGVSQFLFLQSFAPVNISEAMVLISIGSFSQVVSIIAIFTPGGLGVREGVWYLALKNLTAPHISLIYAFVSRLWMIIVEAILLFICLPIAWVRSAKQLRNTLHIEENDPQVH